MYPFTAHAPHTPHKTNTLRVYYVVKESSMTYQQVVHMRINYLYSTYIFALLFTRR